MARLADRSLTGDWLDGKAYYRARFIDDTIDNPDQRIQDRHRHLHRRCRTAAQHPQQHLSGATLLFGAVSSIVSMISFTAILWNLSGTLTADRRVRASRTMLDPAGYVLFATVIAFWIGRPIIWLSFNNEKFNAAFRYALVRLRDASEAVAFYRGELAKHRAAATLRAIVSNYKRYVNRMIGFYGWNLTMSQIIVVLPYVLQFPRFFAGDITLGAMSQSASAFGSIQNGLSFFRNAYDQFAGYRAAIIRLHGLVIANEEGRNCRR